jgi:glycosyltransferase involved in cell wall biosynthesis
MLYLLIVSYNNRRMLERLMLGLSHLKEGYGLREGVSLYVQDNGSTDGSIEYLELLARKGHIEKLVLSDNVGYALACNNLADLSRGCMTEYNDVLGFLNADVWMDWKDQFKIREFFKENQDVAIMGPKQRNEAGRITHAGIFGTNEAPKHRGWQHPDIRDQLYHDVVDAVTVSGSAYFIRRKICDELSDNPAYQEIYDELLPETLKLLNVELPYSVRGAFLPTPFYYEETFCSYYARHMGHRLVYNGNISIGHSWHGSVKTGSKMDQMFRPSRDMFRRACDKLGINHD